MRVRVRVRERGRVRVRVRVRVRARQPHRAGGVARDDDELDVLTQPVVFDERAVDHRRALGVVRVVGGAHVREELAWV